MTSLQKSFVPTVIFFVLAIVIFIWIGAPAKNQLPQLRQTINERRGQLDAYLKINAKQKTLNPETSNNDSLQIIKQAALPQGKELELITSIEKLADQRRVTEKLRLDEGKPSGSNGWEKSLIYLEIHGSFASIVNYLRDLERLPYVLAFNSLKVSQAESPNIQAVVSGSVLWRPADQK